MNDSRNTELGYKAVMRYGELHCKFHSIAVPSLLDYELFKWTYPREYDGPLCVFDSLENLLSFMWKRDDSNKFSIFLCRYVPSYKDYVRIAIRCEGVFQQHISELASGTILAERVMLVDELYRY